MHRGPAVDDEGSFGKEIRKGRHAIREESLHVLGVGLPLLTCLVELPMKLPPTAQRPSPWMNFSPVTQWPSVQRRRYGGKEREKSEAPSVDRSLLTHMHAHTQTNKGGQGIGQTPYKIFDGQNETEEITRHLMNSHLRELILSHICRIRWEGRKTIR